MFSKVIRNFISHLSPLRPPNNVEGTSGLSLGNRSRGCVNPAFEILPGSESGVERSSSDRLNLPFGKRLTQEDIVRGIDVPSVNREENGPVRHLIDNSKLERLQEGPGRGPSYRHECSYSDLNSNRIGLLSRRQQP